MRCIRSLPRADPNVTLALTGLGGVSPSGLSVAGQWSCSSLPVIPPGNGASEMVSAARLTLARRDGGGVPGLVIKAWFTALPVGCKLHWGSPDTGRKSIPGAVFVVMGPGLMMRMPPVLGPGGIAVEP